MSLQNWAETWRVKGLYLSVFRWMQISAYILYLPRRVHQLLCSHREQPPERWMCQRLGEWPAGRKEKRPHDKRERLPCAIVCCCCCGCCCC